MIVNEQSENSLQPPRKVLTVKEMDSDMQPREKAMRHGVSVLSTSELLALILRTGTPGNPVTELCRDLMRANDGNLHNLERRTRKELMKLRGIGTTKAVQIEAVMEIVRRYMAESPTDNPRIADSRDIDRLMRPRISNLDHEEIWVMLLSRSNRVVKLFQASKGGRTASVFDVKIILKEALLENASAVVLCHNHPSGNLQPSIPDDNITRQCRDACRSVDLQLVDHVILSPTGYFSYADKGRL